MPPRRYTTDQWTAAYWQRVRFGLTCWNWTGADNGHGYGVFSIHARQQYAHRIAYELHVGPIPAGTEIDHLCRNRRCVNPDHLEAVSHAVNMHRGDTIAAKNAAKTHCPKGHPFDDANTAYRPNGGRRCRACAAEYQRKRRAGAA